MFTSSNSTAPRVGEKSWFDWLVTFTGFWITTGLFVDGWAHTHGKVDDSFFTPYHGLLYSGLLAAGIVAAIVGYQNFKRGHRWFNVLPRGYELLIPGVILFGIGGGFDLLWHTLFGIEDDIDALLSPTHLFLATSSTLITTAAFRAGWRKLSGRPKGLIEFLPTLLSFINAVLFLTFFTQFAHPIPNLFGGEALHKPDWLFMQMGVTGTMLTMAILSGAILFLVRRFILPWGSLTLLLGLNMVYMGAIFPDQPYPTLVVFITLIGVLLADILLELMRPSDSLGRMRLFAFLVPVSIQGFYFLGVSLVSNIWWTTHLWTGLIFMSGLVGLLVSYLVFPPNSSPAVAEKS